MEGRRQAEKVEKQLAQMLKSRRARRDNQPNHCVSSMYEHTSVEFLLFLLLIVFLFFAREKKRVVVGKGREGKGERESGEMLLFLR